MSGPDSSGTGTSLANAGDVNNDGCDEPLVGAPGVSQGDSVHVGRAYLFAGGRSGLAASPSWMVNGKRSYGYLGLTLASAGDVNGDGYADIIGGGAGRILRQPCPRPGLRLSGILNRRGRLTRLVRYRGRGG